MRICYVLGYGETETPCRISRKSNEFHPTFKWDMSISGLVVEYIVAIDVTRVRFPADALVQCRSTLGQTR